MEKVLIARALEVAEVVVNYADVDIPCDDHHEFISSTKQQRHVKNQFPIPG